MTRWSDLTADQQLERRVKAISNCYYMLAGLCSLFVALGIMGVLLALRRGATDFAEVMAGSGLVYGCFGGGLALVGYKLRRFSPKARIAAYVYSVVLLFLFFPFGMALSIYTIVYLSQARRLFCRPKRTTE